MTNFINTYMPLLVILAIPICAAFILLMTVLAMYLAARFKLEGFPQLAVLILTLVGSLLLFFYGTAKLYDHFNNGKLTDIFIFRSAGQTRLLVWTEMEDYGPFPDGRAWSYSNDTGLSLLDLFEGKVLLNEKQILKRLPKLGKKIRIFSGREYNSRTNAIYVTTPDGKVHRILPDDLGKIDRKVIWLDTNKFKRQLKLKLPKDLPEQLQ